jgi:hypothetical protein
MAVLPARNRGNKALLFWEKKKQKTIAWLVAAGGFEPPTKGL